MVLLRDRQEVRFIDFRLWLETARERALWVCRIVIVFVSAAHERLRLGFEIVGLVGRQ